MPTTNSSIQFKHGLQEAFSNITKDSNTIYFITDTNRLFVGDSEYTRPVQHGSELPTSKNPANSLFVKETGTARELYYSKDGTAWDMIAYLPATITGGVFGNNTAGTVAYGGTVKVPKVTVDNRGYVTAAEDVTITLPTSDKVTTVTSSGDGNAVTGGSISNDGTTLTLTKGESFIPVSGGTFTGAVTLSGAPTTDLNPATKKYVDDSISSAVSASDAMVFKGTVGTSGTASSFSAINVSSATKGDTYKVITADTLPAASSFDSNAHDLTPGDLIVYMGESKFIYVPSGDEDVTSVKVAGSGDTINVSTTAQTGTVVLGDVATKKASTSTTLNGNGASNDNVPTELAVKTYVDDTVGALENTLGTAATTDATDYATAAQGTKADNAMPKSGGTFTGDVTVSGDLTADSIKTSGEITITPTTQVDITTNNQEHDNSKITFVNTNKVNNAEDISIEASYTADVSSYAGHKMDTSTLKLKASNVSVEGNLTATKINNLTFNDTCDYDDIIYTIKPEDIPSNHNTPRLEFRYDSEYPRTYTRIVLNSDRIALNGEVFLSKTPTDNNHAATKKYVDDSLGAITDTKVTTVTTTGEGNAITTGSISNDGTTLTLTKGTSFMPTTGGTFTGAVTLAGAPTTDLNAATKKYVDDSISSSVAASDAMVFKGTVGTSGTVASFSAINVSSATKGDTYKVITADTLPAASSFDSAAHDLTPGDLIVYMGESKFIYVPSGDEDVTSVKIAGSGDTINVSTTAQTGTVVLGDVATKKASTSTTLNGNGASNDNVPTELAVKTYVDDTVAAATLTWKTF